MKQLFNIRFAVLMAMAMAAVSSCHYLDKDPEEDILIEDAFLKRNYAEAFLTDVYADVPHELFFCDNADINPFTASSDEMCLCWPGKFAKTITKGSLNPYNATGRVWINMYEGIRKANLFLKHIDKTPLGKDFTQEDKNAWIGEAYLLRAMYHFYVMRTYGPCLIMDYLVSANDDFHAIKRQPLDDCIDFILKDIEKAISLLPMKITDASKYGRVNGAMAYAMKSRLLLYRASDLWNGNPIYKDFTDKDGVHLFPTEKDDSWWQTAADAAKECIDECEKAGYALYYAPSNDPVDNYSELFLVNNNCEVLYARPAGSADDGYGWIEKCSFPISMGGWAGYDPTQMMVDAYEMDNGEVAITGYTESGAPVINPASGYTETGFAESDGPAGRWVAGVSNMYVHRDPRFYASINYNGAMFKDQQIQLWNSGADGRASASVDYCITGYMMKKFNDPTVNIPRGIFTLKTFIMFRLGEVYLNYAEALNEAKGPVADVHKYVNAIRARAGMPELPSNLTKEQMRERIRRERRVELAFETHRYFDCQRWMIAKDTQSGPVCGMNISAGTHLQDPEYYQRTVVETRVFPYPQYCLFPIMQTEIDKMDGLVQNPYWK